MLHREPVLPKAFIKGKRKGANWGLLVNGDVGGLWGGPERAGRP